MKSDSLTGQDLRVPPADLVEPDVALGIDMGDLDADLVDMALDQHCRSVGIRDAEPGKGVSSQVAVDLIRKCLRFRSPEAATSRS